MVLAALQNRHPFACVLCQSRSNPKKASGVAPASGLSGCGIQAVSEKRLFQRQVKDGEAAQKTLHASAKSCTCVQMRGRPASCVGSQCLPSDRGRSAASSRMRANFSCIILAGGKIRSKPGFTSLNSASSPSRRVETCAVDPAHCYRNRRPPDR